MIIFNKIKAPSHCVLNIIEYLILSTLGNHLELTVQSRSCHLAYHFRTVNLQDSVSS